MKEYNHREFMAQHLQLSQYYITRLKEEGKLVCHIVSDKCLKKILLSSD